MLPKGAGGNKISTIKNVYRYTKVGEAEFFNMSELWTVDYIRGGHGFIATALRQYLTQRGIQIGEIGRDLRLPDGKLSMCDTLYYVASYGNLVQQEKDNRIMYVNADALAVLVAQFKKFRHLIYFSSSSVYGRQVRPMHEKMVLNPNTLAEYAKAKYWGEEICRLTADSKAVTVLRPFSVTGVGEQSVHLIPTAIKACFEGQELPIDPSPVHDFIDIEDLLRAIEIIKEKRQSDTTGLEIYNIGTGIQYNNGQIVKIVEDIVGKKIKTVKVPRMREYDTLRWSADVSKLKLLGWTPKKSLYQSIQEQVNEYQKQVFKA